MRAFPGANTEDMYDHIAPLLRKKPPYILLHIGANDSPDRTSNDILNNFFNLRKHIETVLPTTKVYLPCSVLRLDHTKVCVTLYHLVKKIKTLENVIVNDNIDVNCLSNVGLHLNPSGSRRLAINFLSLIQRL